jgi:predicted CoA-binding protein
MLDLIREFLSQKRFAVAGVSHKPQSFSRSLCREFESRGYEVVPVNPALGKPGYAHVQEILPPVENVLIMTGPAGTDAVVRDCAAAGVKRVWMYRASGAGAVSPEAVAFCQAQGIAVIPGECPLMFLPDAAWFHRLHGVIRKITGAYPK